jgi:hypothetical protein
LGLGLAKALDLASEPELVGDSSVLDLHIRQSAFIWGLVFAYLLGGGFVGSMLDCRYIVHVEKNTSWLVEGSLRKQVCAGTRID